MSAWLYVIRFDLRALGWNWLCCVCETHTVWCELCLSSSVWRLQRTTVSSLKLTPWWSCSWPPVPRLITRLDLVLCWNRVHLVYLRLLTDERQLCVYSLLSALFSISFSFPLSTSSLTLWYTCVLAPFFQHCVGVHCRLLSHTYRECSCNWAAHLRSGWVSCRSQQRCVCVGFLHFSVLVCLILLWELLISFCFCLLLIGLKCASCCLGVTSFRGHQP